MHWVTSPRAQTASATTDLCEEDGGDGEADVVEDFAHDVHGVGAVCATW